MSKHSFGEWLRYQRKALDLTQQGLAEQVPCSVHTLRKLEAGTRRPSHFLAERLARLLLPTEERPLFVQLARVNPVDHQPTKQADQPIYVPQPPSSRHHARLPAHTTSLIGRDAEIDTLCQLLLRSDVRLVTLIGPPGVGKTRLALQTAVELEPAFAHGVAFIALAPLSDPHLLLSTIARGLGLREMAGQSLLDRVQSLLYDRHLLLLLDNFEHLLEVAPLIGDLLAAAPGLKVLVTSRAPLHLYGEHEFEVPPLALPDLQQCSTLASLAQSAAVRLFTARAQAIRPDFMLTEGSARHVAEVCVRLEGLPLAIELAAARSKHLTPDALLPHLVRRLEVLTDGPRDVPARQRTLRDAIAWSYALLAADEQALFRRMGVFVGGCTVEAATRVFLDTGACQGEIHRLLAALVDQSLVQHQSQPDGSVRFTLLEMLREYALEQLEACGEAAHTRDQHLYYFLGLAEEAERRVRGLQQGLWPEWMQRMQQEQDNLRAALQWAQEHQLEQALRLAFAMFDLWLSRGQLTEGHQWLETLLAQSTELCSEGRAKALIAAGGLAWAQGEYVRAESFAEAALAVWQALDNPYYIMMTYSCLGLAIMDQGDYARARPFIEHSLQLAQTLGYTSAIPGNLSNLGDLARRQGDYARAKVDLQQAYELALEGGNNSCAILCLVCLGGIAHQEGAHPTARAYYADGLRLSQQIGNEWSLCYAVEGLAGVAAMQGQPERAARLFGAAARLRETSDSRPWDPERVRNEQCIAHARECLGPECFAAAWAAGRALSLEQVVSYALADRTIARSHTEQQDQFVAGDRQAHKEEAQPWSETDCHNATIAAAA